MNSDKTAAQNQVSHPTGEPHVFDENQFALSIKHALNENAQALPQHTLDKLYAARRQAVAAHNVARNRDASASASLALGRVLFGRLFKLMGAPLAVGLPAVLLGLGLYLYSANNADNYVQTVAEIDSQVLTQELPINALLDKGFVRYVQVGE